MQRSPIACGTRLVKLYDDEVIDVTLGQQGISRLRVVHMAILTVALKELGAGFTVAQSVATATAMVCNFGINNVLTYRDQRLQGWAWLKGLFIFMIACSIGAFANVGVATYLFENRTQWVLAALAGVLVGAVWNYGVTQLYTWGKGR